MKKKSLFAVLLFMLMLLIPMTASADFKIDDFVSNSTFKPVSYSSHKSVSTVTLYGNADYICMKAYKDTSEYQEFWVDIYSDSKRTKKILEYGNTYKKGTKYQDVFFDLTSLKSKTYYATSYVKKYKNSPYREFEKDPATVTNFKIVVKRDGTSLKNMKTILYGYENSTAGPIVYWYSVPGATKYYVYKKTDGKFKKIKTVKAAGGDMSYYVDKALKDKNATAYYKVKAVSGTGSTPLSEDELKVNAVKAPKVTLEYNAKGGIKISWSKVASGATYYVYMAEGNSDWEYEAETTKRSYVYNNNLKAGTQYYFAVIAQTNKGISGLSTEKSILYFNNPEIKSIKEASGNLVISWNTVKGADKYNVYRRIDGDKEWTKIGITRNSVFTDNDVNKNTVYNYRVKSVRGSVECVYGAYMQSKAIIDVPVLNPVKADSQGNPVISWGKIEGASYRVWRKAEDESEAKVIATTKSTSFTDKDNTVNGKKYTYTVNAYVGSEHGKESVKAESFIWLLPVKGAFPSPAEEGVMLNWEEVKNIEGYNIYRKSGEGDYAFLGTSDTNFFNDKSAVSEVSYTYKIVCVSAGTEKAISTAEFPVRISPQYVTVLTETAKTDEPWYCSIKIADFDSSKRYTVSTKSNGIWVTVKDIKTEDNGVLRFRKNEGAFVNEYAVSSISADGTVSSICDENIFTLEYIVPTVITAKADHQNYTITFTWKPVAGAEKYNIYLNGKKSASADGTKTSYKTEKLEPGKYYYYTVGTVKGDTEYSSAEYCIEIIKKPTVKVKNNAKSIRISWDDTSPSHEYIVYRKTSAQGEWKELKKTGKDYYDDLNVVNGKTYYYTVLPIGGAKNEKGVKTTYVKSVSVSGVTLGKKSVELKWEKSPVADYYEICRYEGGRWPKVYTSKNGKTVKFTDTDVESGKKYSYRIYAVKNGTKSKYVSKSVIFIAPPTDLKATSVSSGVKITFDEVSGATKYVIYRKDGKGEYKKIKTLKSSSLSYTDKKVKKGVKYTYYVKAYNKLYSAASSKVSVKK